MFRILFSNSRVPFVTQGLHLYSTSVCKVFYKFKVLKRKEFPQKPLDNEQEKVIFYTSNTSLVKGIPTSTSVRHEPGGSFYVFQIAK